MVSREEVKSVSQQGRSESPGSAASFFRLRAVRNSLLNKLARNSATLQSLYLFVFSLTGYLLLRLLTTDEATLIFGPLAFAIVGMWLWTLFSKVFLLVKFLKHDHHRSI
jgi:hypothetical protein